MRRDDAEIAALGLGLGLFAFALGYLTCLWV